MTSSHTGPKKTEREIDQLDNHHQEAAGTTTETPNLNTTTTAYNLFAREKKIKRLNLSSGDIKQQWKAASEAEKLQYIYEARLRPNHRLTRAEKAILDQWMPVPVPVDVRSYFLAKHAVVQPPFSPVHQRKSALKKIAALTEREKQQLEAEHYNENLAYMTYGIH
ncbi:hypothetical protein ZHAS_00000014 [Anopheles sinensis]|uniref:Uncharacterized protein n=1 Tax=Anopheles sinensis TaxID=74873 RepID=A0A084WUX9_ANOSI|nr:hypothetical protein ZHAS_00000014 [Anopheles sinensis]